jgi:hypothetical protein
MVLTILEILKDEIVPPAKLGATLWKASCGRVLSESLVCNFNRTCKVLAGEVCHMS